MIYNDFFQLLFTAEINIMRNVVQLVEHSNPVIRERVCSLLGYLCKHSDKFYESMSLPFTTIDTTYRVTDRTPPHLLSALIRLCDDPSSGIRKFACFAVGNASFHSKRLYPFIAPALPVLVRNLHASDDKARANAAGALGNMVRNSDDLVSSTL